MARNVCARLVLLGALVSAAGCASAPSTSAPGDALLPPPSPAESLGAAEAAMAAGRHGDAVAHYRRTLSADPDHAAAKLGLAEALLRTGDAEEARQIFDGLLGAPAIGPVAAQGKGLALLAAGNGGAAEAVLRDAVDRDPSLWRAWNALGRYYDGQRRWDDAAEAYRRALAVTPRPATVHNNLGVSLMAQSRYAEAAAQFARALELTPAMKTAQTNLRLSLAFQGHYADALSGAEGEELASALNNAGYAALLSGDLERAEAYFLRALETSASFYAPAWQNLQAVGQLRETGPAHATIR